MFPYPAVVVDVLAVDARRELNGEWRWDNWSSIGTITLPLVALSSRSLLAKLRSLNYLRWETAGKLRVYYTAKYIVITERHSRRPMLALAYPN